METSYAICYMHCGRSRPIIHLNIKSSSIFLDESFTAKSNFGFVFQLHLGKTFFKVIQLREPLDMLTQNIKRHYGLQKSVMFVVLESYWWKS